MQRTSAIRMAGLLAVFFVFDLSGCSQRSRLPPPRDQDLVIKLRWIKSYPNHDILGDDLYNRNDVDSLAPYAAIRGPSDMREASDYEPDLLK